LFQEWWLLRNNVKQITYFKTPVCLRFETHVFRVLDIDCSIQSTGQARVRSQVSPRGICGELTGTEKDFSASYCFFSLSVLFHHCSNYHRLYVISAVDSVVKSHTHTRARAVRFNQRSVIFSLFPTTQNNI
jgi:hypothetical protein